MRQQCINTSRFWHRTILSRAALKKRIPEKTDGTIIPKGAPRRPVGTARPSTLGYRGSDPRSSNPNEACPQCSATREQLSDHRAACLLFRNCTPSLCPYLQPLPLSVTHFHFGTHSLPGCPSITFAVTCSLVTQLSRLER